MKWIAMLRIFDHKLASTWHNGSATTMKAKSGFGTKEEAEEWMLETRYTKYRDDRFKVTECILSYDESQSDNVETMFKYMD